MGLASLPGGCPLHTPALFPAVHCVVRCMQPCPGVQVDALLGGQPLRLGLQGLSTMGDDPTDVHVLYAKVCVSLGTACQ